jgi:type I restriction enzyme M protein
MNPRFSKTIKQIQDAMRKDAGIDGDAERLSQLSWLLLLKFLSDKDASRNATPLLAQNLRWSNWAGQLFDAGGERLFNTVKRDLIPSLQRLKNDRRPQEAELVRSVFADVYCKFTAPSVLQEVVHRLDSIDFANAGERHIVNDVYESLLHQLQTAGNAGEYYTPRAVTRLMVEMVQPSKQELVLDPACGTAGFLVDALRFAGRSHPGTCRHIGIEKKALPRMLAITNLLLHGAELPDVSRRNALDGTSKALHEKIDVVLTNPPFGAFEEAGIEENFPLAYRSRETADLFITLVMDVLKDSGRAAIVLPDGFLYGNGVKTRIKQRLLSEFDLHTIIRLPKGVFSPYTSIATNLLFFEKGRATQHIWFVEHKLPESRSGYSKTKPIEFAEFDYLKSWWTSRRESEFAWSISAEQVAAEQFNLDQRHPTPKASERKSYSVCSRELVRENKGLARHKQRLLATIKAEVNDARSRELILESADAFLTFEGLGQLKQLFLELAFRGKLTSSNEAKGRKNSDHLREEQPSFSDRNAKNLEKLRFRIPGSWTWTRLSELGLIVGGATPETAISSNFADKGIPWLTPADLYRLKGKFVSRGRRDLSETGLKSCSARLLPAGTVLFSSRAPIGYVAIAENQLSTNQGFKSCIPNDLSQSEFLYYYLRAAAKTINEIAPGTTFKEVSGAFVAALPVPLPPATDQREIVRKLDVLLGAVSEYETSLKPLGDAADALRDSLYTELLQESQIRQQSVT